MNSVDDFGEHLSWPGTVPGEAQSPLTHTVPLCQYKGLERVTKRHLPSASKKKALFLQVGTGAQVPIAPPVRAQVPELHPGPCCEDEE